MERERGFFTGLSTDIQDASKKWATASNPFFAGDISNYLGLIPFIVLSVILYLVGREILLKGRATANN